MILLGFFLLRNLRIPIKLIATQKASITNAEMLKFSIREIITNAAPNKFMIEYLISSLLILFNCKSK